MTRLQRIFVLNSLHFDLQHQKGLMKLDTYMIY